jgi:hypothetical protein
MKLVNCAREAEVGGAMEARSAQIDSAIYAFRGASRQKRLRPTLLSYRPSFSHVYLRSEFMVIYSIRLERQGVPARITASRVKVKHLFRWSVFSGRLPNPNHVLWDETDY